MTFGQAIEALKDGDRVCRQGWNGKGMWLMLVPAAHDVLINPGTHYSLAIGGDTTITINPHIDMKTATGEMQPGWLASQADMLSDDWMLV